MAQHVAGFELPEGKSITDLEHWQPFSEWFKGEYGREPNTHSWEDKEIFEVFLAGAYWESQRVVETK